MFINNYKKVRKLLPPPVQADHQLYSMVFSQHDDKNQATKSLVEISLEAIKKASSLDFTSLCSRLKKPPYYPNLWPGEHYKLLAGLVLALKPKLVIELGTATGLSALCMKEHLGKDASLATFDLFSYQEDANTVLKKDDFIDGRLCQYVADLSLEEELKKHEHLLNEADFIFIDVTHDGLLEEKLMQNFQKLHFKKPPYLLFDDIRVWSMLKFWRDLPMPKIDLTSFGHWSGTGLVQWQKD